MDTDEEDETFLRQRHLHEEGNACDGSDRVKAGSESRCPVAGQVLVPLVTTLHSVCEPENNHVKFYNLNLSQCQQELPDTYGKTKTIELEESVDASVDAVTPKLSHLQEILEGLNEPGDCGNPLDEPPPWLNRELFNRGRMFYDKYLFCMSFAETLALVMMMSMSRALKPLIYTGRSDSPKKALRRYFSTFEHVKTWHTGDVWKENDTARKDILYIRGIHNKISKVINSSTEHPKVWNVSVEEKGHEEPACPLYHSIQEDLGRQAEVGLDLEGPDNPPFFISQFDMSMTQYQFFGLVLSHPVELGAGQATEEELEGLVHFWRGIGWLLGIEDKYNFCQGTLAEVRARCLELEKRIAIPALARVDWNYEHMSHSLLQGLSYLVHPLSFPAVFRYLMYTLGHQVPSFVSHMSYDNCGKYWFMRFSVTLVYYFPKVQLLYTYLVKIVTEGIKKHFAKGMWIMNQGKDRQQEKELYPVMTSYTY